MFTKNTFTVLDIRYFRFDILYTQGSVMFLQRLYSLCKTGVIFSMLMWNLGDITIYLKYNGNFLQNYFNHHLGILIVYCVYITMDFFVLCLFSSFNIYFCCNYEIEIHCININIQHYRQKTRMFCIFDNSF